MHTLRLLHKDGNGCAALKPMSIPKPNPLPLTWAQAAEQAPTLARLTELARESRQRLDALRPLLPGPLMQSISPGPIDPDDGSWCLLVSNPAAAAKLRQLLPQLQQHLQQKGCKVTSIRLKLQTLAAPAQR
jgi:hypothetical protein